MKIGGVLWCKPHLRSQSHTNYAAELVHTSLQLLESLHIPVEVQLFRRVCHNGAPTAATAPLTHLERMIAKTSLKMHC